MSSVWGSLVPGDRQALTGEVERYWSDSGDTLVTFSVRAGFDLMLQALDVKEGDEVIFSAINIKGMAKIAKDHGVTSVPLDLDVESLAPSAEDLRRAITPRSRVLVVAHLFGALIDLDALFQEAKRHGLVIVEDCAQAFDGRAFEGHPLADLSLFSFGPLKTSTALGGGLVRVRNTDLMARMRAIQETYPLQRNSVHLKRTMKFMVFKLATTPSAFSLIYLCYRLLGRDYDDAIGEQVRNVAPQGSAKKFRRRPSAALLGLLKRRLYTYREGELDGRESCGRKLLDMVGDAVVVPGVRNPHHNYWVFPILADDPERFIAELKKRGFDSSGWPRSRTIAAPHDRAELDPVIAAQALSDMIFVPCYPTMSERELAREARAIREIAEIVGAERTKGYTRPLEAVAAGGDSRTSSIDKSPSLSA
jgi:dTDP-4-amino-4,6-dideoxygalactose transaminase